MRKKAEYTVLCILEGKREYIYSEMLGSGINMNTRLRIQEEAYEKPDF